MPTFRCTAACTNCGTFSSPAERTTLDREAMLAAIKEAKQLGFAVVVFTGGEATLQRRDLLAGISYATELGLPTRVVSNAYWARSPQKAAKVLDELVGAGLSEINYSTGDEHIRFVPIERVAIASVAAIERQLPVHVMVELRSTRAVTRDILLARPELDALDEEQRKLLHVAESPWMPMEPDQIEQYPAGVAVDQTNIASRSGCDSILRTYTVQSDGRVASCCGLGMRVIDDLNVTTVAEPGFLRRAIETSESDMLKLWIHTLGPDRILAMGGSKGFQHPLGRSVRPPLPDLSSALPRPQGPRGHRTARGGDDARRSPNPVAGPILRSRHPPSGIQAPRRTRHDPIGPDGRGFPHRHRHRTLMAQIGSSRSAIITTKSTGHLTPSPGRPRCCHCPWPTGYAGGHGKWQQLLLFDSGSAPCRASS